MTNSPSGRLRPALLGLAAILVPGFGALALYELRSAAREWENLAALKTRHDAAQKQLEQLERAAEAAAAPVPAPKAAAVPAPTGNPAAEARAKRVAERKAAQKYAREFLEKYPQARAMLIEYQTRNMENYYTPFFRAAGLSQAQINEFIAQTAETHLNSLVLDPNGSWSNGQPNLSADAFRSLLGDAAYQQWQQASRVLAGQSLIAGLGSSARMGGAPLSSDQAVQLAQAIASSSPTYASGGAVNLQSVDLDQLTAQAKSFMSDAQLQQVQPMLTLQAANQQLLKLIQGSQ